MSATVSPERILKQLAALWVEEGRQGAAGALRACTMTLVVVSPEDDDWSALGETIAALMPEHPSRSILVKLRDGAQRELSERVYQQCWMPFGQRRQICCEQIELTASRAALGDLPSVLLPLIVADLPVILWCRNPRLLEIAEFGETARLATKVVLDSFAYPGAAEAFAAIGRARRGGLEVADLAWTRLTRWRETLAQVFENRARLARLEEIAAVKVTWNEGHETAAWYLAAWIADSLARAGVEVRLEVAPGAESLRIELSGRGPLVALWREQDSLMVTVDGLSNRTHLSTPGDCLLMHEELALVRSDPVFQRALSTAARLALSSASG